MTSPYRGSKVSLFQFSSNKNSADETLGASASFVGEFETCETYSSIVVGVSAGAAGTMTIDWSHNGTDIVDTDTFVIGAGLETHVAQVRWRFFRVSFADGGSGGALVLQSFLSYQGSGGGGGGSGGSTNLTEYLPLETENISGTEYFGKTKVDGTWLLIRIITSGADLNIRYANLGTDPTRTTFTLAWTNRATLSYTELENLGGI